MSVQLSVQPVRLAEVVHKALNPKASIVRGCISGVEEHGHSSVSPQASFAFVV